MRATLTLALALTAVLAVAGVAGYALVSQSAPSTAASAGPMGTFDVLVQDAPAANWSHVYVTFDQVAVHPVAGNASDWQTMNVTQTTVDLASTHSLAALIGTAQLKAGMYSQVRILVKSAQGVMTNGTTVTFVVPSGELRTADAFNITVGETTSMTVSIDLSRSIVDASGKWIFTPVLGTVQTS